ncbi:hypothetical protein ACSBLW_09730 [Thioclava sp. FR2]|uniref:hypothetical protein n=1 Tax=Thioclava sp. FR2 TaxID=3445780 RepID=UPI003EB78326
MDDDTEIRALIGAHFDAMKWGDGSAPDWDRFRADFLEGAILLGAARPVAVRSVDGFIDRMETVARKNLQSFEEHTQGMRILRFGNIAVVLALSEMLENGVEMNHDVSGYLLVKSDGRWSIAGHAWDQVSEDKPMPEALR